MSSYLTPDNFERFLTALDPDRERAAIKYEQLRARLIRFFVSKGSSSAEELTDDVINRVIQRIEAVEKVDDVNLYSYGVAKFVLKESIKKQPQATPLRAVPDVAERDSERECLERCIGQLPSNEQDLILEYYLSSGPSKIEQQRRLAEEMHVSVNALRIRAHRIRQALENCIRECRKQDRGKNHPR